MSFTKVLANTGTKIFPTHFISDEICLDIKMFLLREGNK